MTTTTQTRQEYVAKMQQKLDDWNKQIDTLEGRVSTATGPAKETLREQLDKVRHHYDQGRKKIDEIQEAGESSWHKLREEAENIWDAMRHSINYFRSQV